MFRDRLHAEFSERRKRNARYSLRAYARSLGVQHSSLSQFLRGKRRLTRRSVQQLGRRLGLNDADIDAFCRAEDEDALLLAIRDRGLRPDTRWLAARLGIRIDAVNVALQSLLRKRRIIFRSRTEWEAV